MSHERRCVSDWNTDFLRLPLIGLQSSCGWAATEGWRGHRSD